MPRRNRRETIEAFRSDMARLLACVERLSEEERGAPVCGTWTAKDLLAHIAAWDRELLRGLEELLLGRRPAFPGYQEAAFNAQAASEAAEASFAQVLLELQAAHELLLTRIDTLSDGAWERGSPYRWRDGQPMTAASLFDYSYNGATHYGGHAREIEDWLARRG